MYGEHPDLASLATQISDDRAEAATAEVTKVTKDCRTLFLARSYEAALQLLGGVLDKLDYVPEALRLRHTALHEEAERGLIWKQQEAELAKAKPESEGGDTTERTSWALEASTRHTTDAGALRQRDLAELQQLAEESATTVFADHLPAISARARVLAERHSDDDQVQNTANQVFSTTSTRTMSLTSMSKPHFVRPQAPPPPPPVSAIADVVIPPPPVESKPPVVEAPAAPVKAAPVVEPPPVAKKPVEAAPVVAPPPKKAERVVPPKEEPKAAPPPPPAPAPPKAEEPMPIRAEDLPPELQSWGENLAARNQAPPPPAPVQPPAAQKTAAPPPAPPVAEKPVAPPTPVAQAPAPPVAKPPAAKAMKPIAEAKAPAPPAAPPAKAPQQKAPPVQAPPVQRPPEPRVQKVAPQPTKGAIPMWMLVAGTAFIVLIIALVVWKMLPSTPKIPATVVTSTPSGANIQVENETCVTPNCKLKLAAGDYELRASLAGYKPEKRIIHVAPGAPAPDDIALEPLPTTVRVNTNFSNGEVSLDGKSVGALKGGQLEIPNLGAGSHTLKIASGGAHTDVAFSAAVARPPEIHSQAAAQDVAAYAVSTIAGRAQLDCNCDNGTKLSVDGRDLGNVAAGKQDLGSLTEGSHRLQIGEGDGATTHTVQVSPTPSLDLFLDAERNVGILVVQAKISGATVFVDGRQAGVTDSQGIYRAPLPVRDVTVRVSKSGFKTVPQQTASLQNKQETALNFDLQPVVLTSKLLIDGKLPGVSVLVDGREVGATGSKGAFTTDVPPGNHTIELSKNGYKSQRVNLSFAAGDTNTLPSDLTVNAPPAKSKTTTEVANNPPPKEPPPAQPQGTQTQTSKPANPAESPDQKEWTAGVRDSKDPATLQAFANRYPNSPFADVARDRVRQLQTSSERIGILTALQRYSDAYQHRSADELSAIWPSLDKDSKKKLSESFKSAQAIQSNIRPDGEPSITGETATVSCNRNLAFTFPGGESRSVNDRVLISLRKQSGAWFIDSVSVAK